jgi:signal transduction histidine kinase/ligand-binding sensor domain-containing protein/DNA-binding response OmpR family regulator
VRGSVTILIEVLLLLSFSVQAQLSFRHLNKRDGLSQNSVFAIEQDKQGFIWLGTRDGLNKFDGYRMLVYRHKEEDPSSLVSNDVRHLYYDEQTNWLWISTLNGLSCYQESTDQFINYTSDGEPGSLLSNSIRSILRDSKGRLWVGTSLGLHLYDDARQQFIPIQWEHGAAGALSSSSIKVIFEDSNQMLWVGTENGLHLLEKEQGQQFFFRQVLHEGSLQLQDQHIKAIAEEKDGRLWIGTHNGGLSCWQRHQQELVHYRHERDNPHSLSHDNVRSMSIGPDGALWVGTFVGLNRFDRERGTFDRYLNEESNPYSLSSSSVRAVFFDHRGSLWVGTYYGGVDFYDRESNRFNSIQQQPAGKGLSHKVVSSFWEDDTGNLWIGTEGGGLNYFNRQKGSFTHYRTAEVSPGNISGNNVKTLLKTDPYLWIGFFNAGLDRMDTRTGKFVNYHYDPKDPASLPADNVYSLLSEGTQIWVATYGGGLALMDTQTGNCQRFQHDPDQPASLCSNQARVLFKDSRGQYWIGTDDGLDQWTMPARQEKLRFKHFLEGTEIYAMYQTRDKSLWIGTYSNGLYQMHENGELIANYTEENGLPGHTIFGILEGDGHYLWLSTNNGLAKLDRRNNSFTAYNYSDGLRNLEFNFNAYYKTRNGELLFGGTNGATLFRPEDIRINTFVPPLVFTELKSFNEPVPVNGKNGLLSQSINHTEKLTFPYNGANFSLSFAALDYFNPGNNRYAYKLEGLEEQWTYTKGQTEASYTLQRPGEYLFRLKAANNDGLWNHNERQILIRVLPPPWRSGWAYFAYILLAVFIIIAVVRYFRLQHRLQLEELEKSQREQLHQAKLRFFTNVAHEFRTPLTLILGPLETLVKAQNLGGKEHRKLLSVEHNARRLLNLVNQLLNFRKLEADHENMQAAEGNIIKFLYEIYLSFQEHARARNIDYQFISQSEAILLLYDRDKLEKVFFNLLSNAFKFTPDEGRIVLKIEDLQTTACISVRDTGKGIAPELQEQIFKRFYEKEASFHHSFKGTGIGLAISRQLVEMHHGQITLKSEEGAGAAFMVELPKGKSHLKPYEIIPSFRDSEDISNYRAVVEAYLPDPKSIIETEQKPASTPAGQEAPLLLIVEDNQEVQAYIQETFEDQYRLLTASDGQEGLEKAIDAVPDLIISDVMMPRMDGITLCSKLKTHLNTSHIPVILLTARTSLIFKLEGLETGADDYVTKPFSPAELRLRVHNLLSSRQRMREKFGRVKHLEPAEVSVTSADEQFLDLALKTVEREISNADFNIEDFARALAVSRPLLFIKIKALTDLTPNKFVKMIRMKRAAQLLVQQKLTVSEVAYQVGFRDPRYFSKCFQKEYGKTPTNYTKA